MIGNDLKNKSGTRFIDKFGKHLKVGDKIIYEVPPYSGGSYSEIRYGYILGYHNRNIFILPFANKNLEDYDIETALQDFKEMVTEGKSHYGYGFDTRGSSNYMIRVSAPLSLYKNGDMYDRV